MADCLHKTCAVCLTQFGNWIEKISKVDRLHLRRSSNIDDIVDKINASNDSKRAKSSRLCSRYFGFVVQRVAHICTERRAVNNLIEASEQLGPKYLERVASGILKHGWKLKIFVVDRSFSWLLNIVVGTPDKKTGRIELKQVSFGTVTELVKSLELSKNQTKNFCSKYRSSIETQTCIEANIFEKIEALHNRMDEFYTSKEVGFMDGEEVITRTLAHVKDTSNFIQHLITERGIDPHDSIIENIFGFRSEIP
ncbi:uncharacterized protein LOC136087437 [Hydra vulgaris]|uniref:Uncharacterized protein LOC136087437 n=1 Tax=Hydra vulgaris TaxID=6087 RepID=A0ABM4CWI0_HYDVU